MQQNQQNYYDQLISCLDENEKNILRENFGKAEQQQAECKLKNYFYLEDEKNKFQWVWMSITLFKIYIEL